jgi:hypothetical protein
MALKIFLASLAVIDVLIGLSPALWANAPASIISSVGLDSFAIKAELAFQVTNLLLKPG